MLDFGTSMDHRRTPDENDELFDDGIAAEDLPAEDPDDAPETRQTAAPSPVSPVSPAAPSAPRVPPVKPPVLPKCELLSSDKNHQPQPGLRNSPHFLHRRRKAEEFSDDDKMETSRILREARSAAGLSLTDVEHATQIRSHYVEALENADYDSLPQPVYVLAYLRKLCQLYSIPEEDENTLVKPWRNIHRELPENLSPSLRQDSGENPNQRIVRNVEIAIFAGGGIIAIGVVVLVVVLIVSYISGRGTVGPAFDNSELLELQDKPALIAPQYPAVRKDLRR